MGQMASNGSFRKLPSGKWQVRYTDPDGIRRTLGTYLTKQSGQEALRKVLSEIDKGVWELSQESNRALLDGKTLTLAQVAERYRALGTRGGNPLSPRTLNEYEGYIRRDFASYADRPIRSLKADQVEDWWIEMGERGTLSLRQKAYSHLKSVTKFALKKGWIVKDPCDIRGGTQAPRVKNPIIPTKEQADLMAEVAPENLRALILIATWGGFRKGELLELRRKDIRLDETSGLYLVNASRNVVWLSNGQVEIRVPKYESGRENYLPTICSEAIRKHLLGVPLDPEALLFPEPGTNNHYPNHKLNRSWNRIREQVGYSGSFHTLRSFAGTQYAIKGATTREIMDYLGHNNIKTAMRYQKNPGRQVALAESLGN
jgi:integrase